MTDDPGMGWVELLQDGMDMKAGAKMAMPKMFADELIAEGAAKIGEGAFIIQAPSPYRSQHHER